MTEVNISVIIPAFNAEGAIKDAINSCFDQTLPPVEIIVVNDGSQDGTEEVVRKYGKRIVLIKQENAGQGGARNVGLETAKGNYIAFLDADDYWLPKFLATTADFLEKSTNSVAVSTGLCTYFNDRNEEIGPPCLNDGSGPAGAIVLDDFYKFWAEQDHVRTGSVLIRQDIIKIAGHQRADLRVSQDLEYWGYIATFGKWGFIPKPLWVGNSRRNAKGLDWLKKYHKRRKLCPTVESWQRRILPRLKDEQLPYFYKVRGRVASGYAQNQIIAGQRREALHIVKKYGDDMPKNRLTHILRTGARSGTTGWLTACMIIVIHEYFKAIKTVFS